MLEYLRKLNAVLDEALDEVKKGHVMTREEINQLDELRQGVTALRNDFIRYSPMPAAKMARMMGLSEARISQIRNPYN